MNSPNSLGGYRSTKMRTWHALHVAVLLFLAGCSAQTLHTVDGTLSRASEAGLGVESRHYASEYSNGPAALSWLADDYKIIPQLVLPPGAWSSKLIIGYAGGYTSEILKPLIYGVLANAAPDSVLVLFCPQGDNLSLSHQINATGRVLVQEHVMPEGFDFEDLPYPVSLRFYVAISFLKLIKHTGHTFFLDTRDVFIQSDPFFELADDVLHFPRESGAYRLKGPYTDNADWFRKCYDNETLAALGGNYVLNSGTIIGPTHLLIQHFELLTREMEVRWHCRRWHGSDQAMHNFLVYTGRASQAGIRYQIEDQVQGLFAFMAYTHPALWDYRFNEDGREEMYNKGEGKPYVAIHMWPGANRIDKQIIRPFVRAFDESLHPNKS